eukprot:TRINITY_DN2045_c0_g1_i1.p1 TRINITY_DN2045_c0_g1~~TRINITY_DN2045_c0_g1_i1.p1  ORF type:complete len:304 (+),score=44.99 TRINITY_DN2045_c0_g1_i1:36-914(+)
MANEHRSVTIGLVQHKWRSDPVEHANYIANAVKDAAARGAQVVFLQELTLHRYFGDQDSKELFALAEPLREGPTGVLLARVSSEAKVFVIGSLFEKFVEESGNTRYFNTAVIYSDKGEFFNFTRKQHIPTGAGYNEDLYFEPGDSDYPVHDLGFIKIGIPTCYDQWFPELARIYALKGAELLVYPTAIGSEPLYPDLDSSKPWQTIITSHAIANGIFVAAVNRVGFEGLITFYGTSFVAEPTGDVVVKASRTEEETLVATLDFRRFDFWRNLFPLLRQRRPTTYGFLLNSST